MEKYVVAYYKRLRMDNGDHYYASYPSFWNTTSYTSFYEAKTACPSSPIEKEDGVYLVRVVKLSDVTMM